MHPSPPLSVIGIDVGGIRKGFHAVALTNGRFHDKVATPDIDTLVSWCSAINPLHIAIDAPCRWSSEGKSRKAEKEIYAKSIHSFYTPTLEIAGERAFYGWVRNGRLLYQKLETRWKLYDGIERGITKIPSLLETFPHAVNCTLLGRTAKAREKREDRALLLGNAGIELPANPSQDTIDAALCALVAGRFAYGLFTAYGGQDGWIVVPSQPTPIPHRTI